MTEVPNILKQVDFFNDDGIYLPMINDAYRNIFYKGAIQECKDQHCIDVGFGTGLLSFAALDSGAKSVIAYEVDTKRFEIGKHIIKKLNLESKITLINKRFYADAEDVKDKVIFHELVSQRVWGENLYRVLGNASLKLIPNQYTMEISEFEFDNIQLAVDEVFDYPMFNPVVRFKNDYVKVVQQLLDEWVSSKSYHIVPPIDRIVPFRNQAKVIAEYSYTVTPEDRILELVDKTGKRQMSLLNNPEPEFELNIESDKPRLLFCDYYIKHNQYSLNVNHAKWYYPEDAQYLVNTGITKLHHTLLTGRSTLL